MSFYIQPLTCLDDSSLLNQPLQYFLFSSDLAQFLGTILQSLHFVISNGARSFPYRSIFNLSVLYMPFKWDFLGTNLKLTFHVVLYGNCAKSTFYVWFSNLLFQNIAIFTDLDNSIALLIAIFNVFRSCLLR